MENPATYDDFQRELEEYIRKQRARGLQPEIRFRKETEMLEPGLPFGGSPGFPAPYKRLRTVDSPLPRWSHIHRSAPRLDSLLHGLKNHYFFQNPWPPSPPGPRAAAGGGGAARLLPKGRWSVHPAGEQDPGPGRRSAEDGGDLGLQPRAEQRRKKRGAEGEARGEKGRRPEGQPGSRDKRERGKRDGEQGRSRSHGKKRPRGPGESGPWDLWDEAILGSCC